MNTLPIGTVQTMTVSRKIDTGYVLEKNGQEALLHHNEADHAYDEGREIDVFLYNDKKGNIAATTTLPSVQMDTYDWAEVVEVIPKLGAFVNIGIAKEMLVSVDDLPLFEAVWPHPGDKLFITLGRDQKGRLLAVPATEGIIAREVELAPEELYNQPISGTVYHTSKEGSAIITEDDYRGFIHHTERKEEPRLGEFVHGRVIDVKVDGTLNVSLRPLKQDSIGEDATSILAHLEENNGVIPFNDKSDPEDIRGTFRISKAAFKRALGRLLKEGKVEQRDGMTYLK
ncbi:S1 RNA-binding domain-containing protein [Oceanobacillus polygoni]|uniref:RNA-binding protein (Virulence factor B family) n=1 Tax=Oceanobacillus polygoni TaxID=1235259 RepID=A0A9X1CHJ7_9BACI|nr:S1-like domain-containing RNA-binding protein [Oceanobacillus polygoni]MBP2078835.1 putative RNA-binding protein (virulence factor B family) [Oceanobacillus polygoni]